MNLKISKFYVAIWIGLILSSDQISAEPPDFSAAKGSAEQYPVSNEHVVIARSIFQAIEEHDIDWVVTRMAYPVKIRLPGEKTKLVSCPNEFRKILQNQFNVGLNQKMLEEIREDPELFSNYQGVMMGKGTVWFVGSGTAVEKMAILAFGIAYQPE